ncbi:MAG: serine/threonine protein kinase [Akkermansiaceae bacterium]
MSDSKEERYKIIKLLSKDAAGGMYLAEDTMLGRKVVYRHMEADVKEQQSADRAAEMASYAGKLCAFQHPNIITIYDVPIDESGFSLVTQYVEGETLAERLTQGPLREFGAYCMAADLLEALHAAHDAGVYHGALHTGSIKRLARATGGFRYLILDLGLNTLATMVKGQDIHIADPVLLAPELQADDIEPDESADLFMLGQLCYTAIAGGHPFSGRSDEDCAAAHLAGQLPPVTDYVPDMNPDFAAWVMKMCAGNREDRPLSIDEATQALHAFKVYDPDAKSATSSVPVATVPMATIPSTTETVPMAKVTPVAPVVPVAVATVPMAVPVDQSQKVPVAVPTAQQSAPMATVRQAPLGATGPQSSLNISGMGTTGEVADFSATQAPSNQKIYIVIGALVTLIAVGVGLKFLLPSNDKAEEKTELVVIDPNVKAYLHDVELVGQKGNTGLVNLDGENTLDWMVLSGATTSGKKDQQAGKPYRINVTTQGRYQEVEKKGMPVFFEVKGNEYTPNVGTSNKLGAKAGNGWNVLMRLPKNHKGSMLVNLYMLQEWCGFDVEINLGNEDVVDLVVPALDAGVTHIPIEIPNAKGGNFYNIKITASKDTTGDFAMGLCAVHVEKR